MLNTLVLSALLKELRTNNDTKTTVIGVLAGAVLASQLDFGKLLHKDPTEIGKAAGVVLAALLGYYTNKQSTPKTPTQ